MTAQSSQGRSTDSDWSLVQRFQRGDEDAFRELFLRFQRPVFHLAVRILENREEAEDTCQEVFISIRRALPGFKGESRLSTWIYRVAVNHALNRLKSLRRRGERNILPHEGVEQSSNPGPGVVRRSERSPEHAAEHRQLLRIVEREMGALDPELRVVLVLRDVQGLPYAEISEVLDMPEGTVKSRLHKARNEMKKRMEPYLG
ncbi:MAG: sigma-70 family RNA polymerase sigma factor [bacterium]